MATHTSKSAPQQSPARAELSNADDKLSGHERQVHHRNYSGKGPGENGYVNVPPGEEGQYGMRRSGSELDARSAGEEGSRYPEWVKDQTAKSGDKQDGKAHDAEDFNRWKRDQTAPGTNVGASEPNKSK